MITRAEIKLINSLSSRSARVEQGLFVAEGEKLVGEILDSSLTIERLYVCGDIVINKTEQVEAIQRISPSEMERISSHKTPQGVLALVRIPDQRPSSDHASTGVSLVLDTIQDPGNMGTIIRLADWFGIGEVFCSKDSADCYNPKTVQATMGAITRVRVIYTDLAELLKNSQKPIYGTFLDGENIYTTVVDSPDSAYIVMGNEGQGISRALEPMINHRLLIPSAGGAFGVESLNVAVATAITCAEFYRLTLTKQIQKP